MANTGYKQCIAHILQPQVLIILVNDDATLFTKRPGLRLLAGLPEVCVAQFFDWALLPILAISYTMHKQIDDTQ